MALINCGPIYQRTVSGCVTYININWVPDGSLMIYLKVTLQSGKSFVYAVMSDMIGTVQLERNMIAPGFWNPSDGVVMFEFFYDYNLCERIVQTICGVDYMGLAITFDDSDTPVQMVDVICVCEEEVPL